MFPSLSAARARELVESLAKRRILVIGDVMLDQFTIGSVTRMSPEAPVPVVAFDRDEFRAGGAANVAVNVPRARGSGVDLIGVVGADGAADRLRELLSAADVASHALVTDDKRRTTAKVRIVTHPQSAGRADRLRDRRQRGR